MQTKGAKTPELAAGYVKKIVSDFMAATKRRLLKVCNRLSPAEREIVMGNFSKGSLHMGCIITLKLAIWDNLPHKLAVMGHCDENIAREGFREVMMLYRASGGVGAGEAIHRLAHLICSAVSPIKEEREAWLRGVPRSQLPRIISFCSKMRFLSTSERAIEAKHAITTRNLKRTTNLSEAGVAFELRGTELGRRLDKRDDMLVSLVEFVETLRGDPENMLAELGLLHHPKVVQIRKKKKDISRRVAAEIIDHCDSESKYIKLDEAKRMMETHRRDRAALVKRLHGPLPIAADPGRPEATETLEPEAGANDVHDDADASAENSLRVQLVAVDSNDQLVAQADQHLFEFTCTSRFRTHKDETR